MTSAVRQGALSSCLPSSSSCWVQWRAAVEAWPWVGLGLKQGTQSFGADVLLLREGVHGAAPVQAQAPSGSPQGDILLTAPLLHSSIHKAFWHLKPPSEFLMLLMLIVAAATHEREACRYLEFGRFSAADVAKALVTGLMKKHVLKSINRLQEFASQAGFWQSRFVPAKHLFMNGREEETSKNLSWTYCCTSWSTDFLSQRLGSGMTFDLPWQSETPQRDWVLLSPNPSISVFLYSSYKWTNIFLLLN